MSSAHARRAARDRATRPAWVAVVARLFRFDTGWALAARHDSTPDKQPHAASAVGVVRGRLAPPTVAALHGTAPARRPPRHRRSWCIWFVGFFLVALGWSLLTPINQYPDESDHVFRAVSVVRGHVFPHIGAYNHGTGAVAPVPRSIHQLYTNQPCRGLAVAPLCAQRPGHPDTVDQVSSEGRMFPLYYAAVGWPSLLFPDRLGVRLMRAVNGALCAVLLASAATILTSMPRRRIAAAAALSAGLTPLAINLTGSVNPSAPETAAAICFWAAILALIHETSTLPRRALLLAAALSGTTLTTARFLGPFWTLLILALSLLTIHRSQWRRFLTAIMRPVLAPVLASALLAGGYALTFRSYQTFASLTPITLDFRGIVTASLHNTGRLLKELVAYFGWLTIPPPYATLVSWAAATTLILILARYGSRRALTATLTGLVLIVALPFAFQVAAYPRAGAGGWQGRYTLPLAVGVPLLAVIPAAGTWLHRRTVTTIARTTLAACAIGQATAIRSAQQAFTTPAIARAISPTIPPGHLPAARLGLALLVLGALALIGATITRTTHTTPKRQPPPPIRRQHRRKRDDASPWP